MLFRSEQFVIPVNTLCKEENLSDNFSYIVKNEHVITKHLKDIMPEYSSRSNVRLDTLL